ncbi:hypothetical protein [Devosia sp.]|jgi:hypothetical protein|uniref:hypothetical protein n=1 Tax=Devosia sp. TaxID=1871048 RepID=UPI0037BFD3C2
MLGGCQPETAATRKPFDRSALLGFGQAFELDVQHAFGGIDRGDRSPVRGKR